MKIICHIVLLLVAAVAIAQDKPSMFQSQTMTIEAVVEAIDHEARLVTLRRGDGSSFTFTPSPDVRNLDQVDVGDVLHAEYTQSVSIQVASIDGATAGEGAAAAVARTEEGEMPALMAVESQMIVANVVAIDLETNTYKLEFVDGTINEYVAMNPENLRMADVGDVVIIEITDAIAAVVQEVDPGE